MASTFDLILSRIPPGSIGKMESALHHSKIRRKLESAAEHGRIPERKFFEDVAGYTGLSLAELVAAALTDAGFVLDPPIDVSRQGLVRRIGELPPAARKQLDDYLGFLESR